MTKNFEEYQEVIKIIPDNPAAACSADVLEREKDFIIVQTNYPNNIDGQCEVFGKTKSGIVYFKSTAQKIDDKKYKINTPSNVNLMQRREYTRISFNASVILKIEEQEYEVLVTDISAGGMKVVSPVELPQDKEYEFKLQLSKNFNISGSYSPIHQEKGQNNEHIISGRFMHMTNKERIALVQFCFSRQMENTNK